jgi:flagellar hook assembly protein FlgD
VLTRNDNVQVAVSIYDFSGKKVRTLTVPPTNSNLIEIPWDLNNSSHKKVGRGTYFARIVANDGVKKAERTIKISVK